MPPVTPASEPGLQLLLVDDNEDLRNLTAFVLERAGHVVAQAESGEAALEQLERGLEPALILLDLSMPGMSGMDVLDVLKSKEKLAAIPVVIISGNEPSSEASASGLFVGYLKKPVSPSALLAAVATHATRPPPGDGLEPAGPVRG